MPINPNTSPYCTLLMKCPKCLNWFPANLIQVYQRMEKIPGSDLVESTAVGTCPICGCGSPYGAWATHSLASNMEVTMQEETEFTDTQNEITTVCNEIRDLLLEKNRKYGDSALNPKRIFSKADAVEQIKVRLDDKISRLMNQQSDDDEDVVMDLMGYLVLLRVALKRRKENC